MATKRRPAGLTDRLLSSGLLKTFGLDALLVVALAAIGATVYRLSPDLVWGYAGLVLLATWWSIGKANAAVKGPQAS